MSNRPVYLDYQATTPVDRRVMDVMTPYFTELFGNAHSGDHPYATEAGEAVDRARRQIADLIGAEAREIVFTSGATEANNLLIAGAARRAHQTGRNRVLTLATEHKSVLEVAAALGGEGFEVDVLPVGADGLVDLDRLDQAVTPETAVVSVMAANNEIGVLQPLAEIGRIARDRGAAFHTDAAQAAGKVALDVRRLSVDLMSLSSHKLYGPKGIGAAWVRRSGPFRPLPVAWGGGQEGGLRPGTLPTPLCAGFGEACALAALEMQAEGRRLAELRDRFLAALTASSVAFAVNGSLSARLPGNLNLSFEGVDAEALLMTIRNRVAAASGSACTAYSLDPSHVVEALGFGRDRAERAVRFGFGRPTTIDEVDSAAMIVADAVRRLRRVRSAPELGLRAS